jgi:hypothetical protein
LIITRHAIFRKNGIDRFTTRTAERFFVKNDGAFATLSTTMVARIVMFIFRGQMEQLL